nr:actin-related protein 5 isoform X1 [Ipomoea batatas]
MPFISKIQRQSDYSFFPSSCPIVIDNGASYFRIGWAGESDPRVIFRNIVQRPRHKTTGETVTIVGDHNPALLKYFDCTRSGPRSAFDNNVVYQFEIMEYILDFGFDRLGADQSQVHFHEHSSFCLILAGEIINNGSGAIHSFICVQG